MAYISKYSGEELDANIAINNTQNDKISNIEIELSNLNKTITTVLNSELTPIKNKVNEVENKINTEINEALGGLKFKKCTYSEYLAINNKDINTLYIITD